MSRVFLFALLHDFHLHDKGKEVVILYDSLVPYGKFHFRDNGWQGSDKEVVHII